MKRWLSTGKQFIGSQCYWIEVKASDHIRTSQKLFELVRVELTKVSFKLAVAVSFSLAASLPLLQIYQLYRPNSYHFNFEPARSKSLLLEQCCSIVAPLFDVLTWFRLKSNCSILNMAAIAELELFVCSFSEQSLLSCQPLEGRFSCGSFNQNEQGKSTYF